MSLPTPNQPILEMSGANIAALRDASLTLLEDVHWTVRAGEFWVVAGRPHSGKSDLLLHAAGLLSPTAGTCRLYGVETGDLDETHLAERLRVGLVFPDGKLFNQLTIAENIALPLRYHQPRPEAETTRIVNGLLELMELQSAANATPENVAAVWRQRAALARALALAPELLLLDNPHAGLSSRQLEWLQVLLDQLWHGHAFFGGRPMTLVAATDDLPHWQHPQRKFAAIQEGRFAELGAWGQANFMQHPAVQELLPASADSAARPAPQSRDH
jgi:ABC-type transporter Mla maintaining outer membrane lipid asymmetry ATPase subunit MlaF